ncbi:hypothetical protein [Laspinema palackyanum]|uniref:hypothetical protein n=1 Tax=Laspinema palackyanum TaxID=3231601 RepID=UPI00345D5891|nr:hypothetical protein [Laspinema sp. D2c]
MPMDRRLYPKNWDDIARTLKDEADWTCQRCGKPCRRPGVSWPEFVLELLTADSPWYELTFEEIPDASGASTPIEKQQRFTLTVAHLNHDPSDCRPENLQALCAVCHLQHDVISHVQTRKRNRYQQLEKQGQLNLFGGENAGD